MQRRISIVAICLAGSALLGAGGCKGGAEGGTPPSAGVPTASAPQGASDVMKQQSAQQAELGRRQQQLMQQAAQKAH